MSKSTNMLRKSGIDMRAGGPSHGYGRKFRLFNALIAALAVILILPAASVRAATPIVAPRIVAPRIIALGDSLTAGYGLAAEDSFPSKLEQALNTHGVQATVINAGVSGDTSAGGLARLDWVMKDKPDAVILELGANDGLRGFDPKEMAKNLDAILSRLDAAKIPVLIAGMRAPPNLGRDYGAEYESVFRILADEHHATLYPFFLDGSAGNPELTQADGLHPTAKGVDVIVGKILPSVLQLIGAGG